jgi:hypothetical protein
VGERRILLDPDALLHGFDGREVAAFLERLNAARSGQGRFDLPMDVEMEFLLRMRSGPDRSLVLPRGAGTIRNIAEASRVWRESDMRRRSAKRTVWPVVYDQTGKKGETPLMFWPGQTPGIRLVIRETP